MEKNFVMTLAAFGLFLFSANTVSAQNSPKAPEERWLNFDIPHIKKVQKEVDDYAPENVSRFGQIEEWKNLVKGTIEKIKGKKKKAAEKTDGEPGENEQPTAGAPQGEIYYNPDAPPDYDANLKVGDLGIALDDRRASAVRILGKSNGALQTRNDMGA